MTQNGTSGSTCVYRGLEDHLGDGAQRARCDRDVVHVEQVARRDAHKLLLAETQQTQAPRRPDRLAEAHAVDAARCSSSSRPLRRERVVVTETRISSGIVGDGFPEGSARPEEQAKAARRFWRLAESRHEPRPVVRMEGEVAQPEQPEIRVGGDRQPVEQERQHLTHQP